MQRIHLGLGFFWAACMSVVPFCASAAAGERFPMIVVFHENRVTSGAEVGLTALAKALPRLPDVANLGYADAGVVESAGSRRDSDFSQPGFTARRSPVSPRTSRRSKYRRSSANPTSITSRSMARCGRSLRLCLTASTASKPI